MYKKQEIENKILTRLEIGNQLVDNILHGSVEADVLKRMRLMYDNLACRTGVLLLQMLHQTALAERVQAFGDRRSVNQVSATYLAGYVTVESFQFYPPLHGIDDHHLTERRYLCDDCIRHGY